jgi:hypothetical protein
MNSNILEGHLILLRSKLQNLEYELKTARFSIDSHCSNIKALIDFEAELMIKEVNDKRLDLLNQLDEYQNDLFENLERRIDRSRVEKTLAQGLDILSSEDNIELVKHQLKVTEIEEHNLRKDVFNKKLIFRIDSNPELEAARLVLFQFGEK